MKQYKHEKFLDGFVFLEGPRWHDGALWVSDMMAHKVYRISKSGEREMVVEVPKRPSGLGFMPDGTPVIVSMLDRLVYKLIDGELVLHTDASATVNGDLNDMVVDSVGRAYIGNFGYDIFGGGEPATAEIILVDPDGSHRVVADNLECPNGTVISADGRTLIVAESFAGRLTAFDRAANGDLSNRRVYAEFPGLVPDGMCLDVDGNIWVALFADKKFVHVNQRGEVIGTVDVGPGSAIACQLGGDDGRTLFCLIYAGEIDDIAQGKPNARIEVARVNAAAAGSP
ncbi:MAG: SMP-30/gluconolactonase/LRE family protein [Proteobacteria bacterium]|nr:SMP-30/gluconolactonase/LRE family protein [Pseudomonadota bacterium]